MEEMNNNELEKLSIAIVNAIVKSEDVQKALVDLQEEGIICQEGLMVLMIRMRALTDAAEELRDIAKELNEKDDNNIQVIDGKELSPQELAYHEYCSERFDEKKWLKNIKVSFKH